MNESLGNEQVEDRGIAATASYWIGKDGLVESAPIIREKNNLEQVNLQYINRENRPNPKYKAIFVGLIHPDEGEASKIFDEDTSADIQFPHLKVMEAHSAAGMFNKRELPVPFPEKDLLELTLENISDLVIFIKGQGYIGLDDVIDAYHEDSAREKLFEIFKINPECAEALSLQNDIRTISILIGKNEVEQAQQKLDSLKPRLIKLALGNEWVIAKKINLNRQFPIDGEISSWDDVEKQITYPEARMFLQLIKDHPELKYLISIHEDPEHGSDDEITHQQNAGKEDLLLGKSGVYFYDSNFGLKDDPDKELIKSLHENLVRRLVENGFRILNGLDSETDQNLGFSADHGYANSPNVNSDGKREKSGGSLEEAFVEIGRLGLTGKDGQKIQAERAFCLEIPGRLSPERKALLLKIYKEELIVPFLASHGIS